LLVNNDVSFNGNLSVGYDISVNRYLNVGNNAYFNNNVYVNKDEWVTGNVYIVGDISLNGNQYIRNNVKVGGDISITGQLSVNGNSYIGDQATDKLTVISSSEFISDVSMNGNLDISGNTSMNGKLLVSGGDTTLKSSNVQIGMDYRTNLTVSSTSTFKAPVTMIDMSANNVISETISSKYLTSKDSELHIGANATNIVIGGANTFIRLSGSNITTGGTPTTENINSLVSKYITLNNGTSINDIKNGGIYINKNNITSAFFLVSSDEKQVKFKAPSSSNVVSINLHDLSTKLSTNNNGILVLNRYNDGDESTSDLKITHQINISSFDISNILQRSMTESNLKTQVVTTDLSIKGNLIINSSITSTTSALDISGNFVHSNGWIKQF
jgi:predicted acyltransferase (DUF342 family)